uniref:Uncharacterized protein n=1 Tax=Arundo donax TaxID=35708 RepID=A0A0A8ZTJ7_ARUDO
MWMTSMIATPATRRTAEMTVLGGVAILCLQSMQRSSPVRLACLSPWNNGVQSVVLLLPFICFGYMEISR